MSDFFSRHPGRCRLMALTQRAVSYLYFCLASCAMTDSALPGAVLCLIAQGFPHAWRAMQAFRRRAELCWQGAVCALLLLALALCCAKSFHPLLMLLAGLCAARYALSPAACRRGVRAHLALHALVLLGAMLSVCLLAPRAALPALLAGFAVEHLLATLCVEPVTDAQNARECVALLRGTGVGRTGFRLLVAVFSAGMLCRSLLFRAFGLPALLTFCALVLFFGFLCLAVWTLILWENRRSNACPTNAFLLGLMVWSVGAVLLDGGAPALMVGFSVSGIGCGLVCRSAIRLVAGMRDAVRFLLADHADAWDAVLDHALHFAQATGCALAAALLCAVLFLGAPTIAVLAAAALLLLPFLAAWQFPLSRRYLDKLTLYFAKTAAGEDPVGLRKQLETRLTGYHPQHPLIRLVVFIGGLVYRVRTVGLEHVDPDPDDPPVFLCNHGDLHGPVAAYLATPGFTSPWSISTISEDHETAFNYLYKYDWAEKTWMPVWLRKLCAHTVAAFALCGTSGLETIPVFRDHPVKLRNTFRASVDAMAAGDALLIFPENPNAAGQDHGYELTGLGELFSGFAMVAPAYYSRTGKRCRFIPMYAHKASHTVAFGEEIVFDPENAPADERERITAETASQMLDLCDMLEKSWQAKAAH